MSSTYNSSFDIPLELHNETVAICKEIGEKSFSGYFRRALRTENRRQTKMLAKDYLSKCTDKEIQALKEEIKKWSY